VKAVALGLGSYWGARSIIQKSAVESRDRMRELEGFPKSWFYPE
jgi:hypothetical protein